MKYIVSGYAPSNTGVGKLVEYLISINQNNKCNHGNNKITEVHHNHRKIQEEEE